MSNAAANPTGPDLRVPVDDRVLSVWVSGAVEGPALLFQPGTPAPPARWDGLETATRERGLRLVAYARPGYSGSTRQPGRTVADAATDVAAVMSAVGAETFVTLGHSGGGPHALACAALLPERCEAAISLAGVAPYQMFRDEWLNGMAQENLDEFDVALRGEAPLRAHLAAELVGYAGATPDDVAAAFGGLVTEVDRSSLTGDLAAWLARSVRRAALDGLEGWLDDDLAFVEDWGFDLSSITVPVGVWQGRHDAMVPFAHGGWLADLVPAARARLLDDEGHLSLLTRRLGDILDDLLSLADLVG
jgi:pimeloyl-ACP methyl ester carboxylesterase